MKTPRKWRRLSLFEFIVALIMLVLGAWGAHFRISPELQSAILGIGIGLLISLSAQTIPQLTGALGSPTFTRFRLVNLANLPASGKARTKDAVGNPQEPSIPAGPAPDPEHPMPVPPGGTAMTMSVDPPLQQDVTGVEVTIEKEGHSTMIPFDLPDPGQRMTAVDAYVTHEPVSQRYMVKLVCYSMMDTDMPETARIWELPPMPLM